MRQMLAILSQPNRSRALASLRMPTAVIHGTADKMVHISGGRATARAIPGAELLVVDGMGHDMPRRAVRDLHRRDPAYGGPGRHPASSWVDPVHAHGLDPGTRQNRVTGP